MNYLLMVELEIISFNKEVEVDNTDTMCMTLLNQI
jgi:hypothetical protein